MADPIRLSDDEIRMLLLLTDHYQAAQIRAQMASEINDQYQAQLRLKYGLDEGWVCLDALTGFVKVGTNGDDHD